MLALVEAVVVVVEPNAEASADNEPSDVAGWETKFGEGHMSQFGLDGCRTARGTPGLPSKQKSSCSDCFG